MFSHDPYQSYSAFTPYIGASQFGLPHFGQTHPGLNPLAQNPIAAMYGGIQPLQLQAALAAQAAIQQLQNPLLAQLYQNPLLGAGIGQLPLLALQNPLLALQNPLLNPIASLSPFGQPNPYQSIQQSPYQQSPYQQSPYQQSPLQQINPFQLQPQSWVGQPYGAVNPLLQQFGHRGQGGMNPWGVS